VYGGATPDEDVELLVDRALPPPVNERVEEKLVAPVSVLLPTIELVVAGQRHAFLEATLGVGRPANDVTLKLQAKRHVEILGHV